MVLLMDIVITTSDPDVIDKHVGALLNWLEDRGLFVGSIEVNPR
ncbi:hypothetical protein SEA_CHANGELING_81 [Mycobacterium phage Changeling]|nr:hypothetical protein SEA_CHANGELING_81 [Mycobacterium phage Changeling]